MEMGSDDIAAHLRCHPLRLQQGVHAQAVHRGQESFSLGNQGLLGIGPSGVQEHDQAPDGGSYGAVAALGFGCQDRFDPCCVPESHPHAGVHGELLIQGQELAKEVHHCRKLFRTSLRLLFDECQGFFQPCSNAVNDSAEGEHQEVVAAGKVVPDRAHSQTGLIRYFPEGRPFQAIAGNDPENGLDNFLAPGFGINNFGH